VYVNGHRFAVNVYGPHGLPFSPVHVHVHVPVHDVLPLRFPVYVNVYRFAVNVYGLRQLSLSERSPTRPEGAWQFCWGP